MKLYVGYGQRKGNVYYRASIDLSKLLLSGQSSGAVHATYGKNN